MAKIRLSQIKISAFKISSYAGPSVFSFLISNFICRIVSNCAPPPLFLYQEIFYDVLKINIFLI